MIKTIQILFLAVLILTWNSVKSQQRLNDIKTKGQFSIVKDTISINIKGEMTHALKFKEKYYVLFEQQLLKYGGHGKRWLCILAKGRLEKVIECPKDFTAHYLDFYVKNDSIILKPYMDNQSYNFDIENYTWKDIENTDDLLFEDNEFLIYSLDFGEWGGKTWFKDKQTGLEYVLECTTPLINKIGKTYYLTNPLQVLTVKNPLELTLCGSDVTYENIQKTRKYLSWYSQTVGYEILFDDEKEQYFDSSDYPIIVSSFVFNDELLNIYKKDSITYLSRILNKKIEPFEKILDNVSFFNGYYSYRCKNLKGGNELLKFNTKNEQIFGLTSIVDNKIIITYIMNKAELKPRVFGKESSNKLFENRLKTILANFKNLNLSKVESNEEDWKTFDITPNHKIGPDNSWNPNKYVIDINKSYLVIEDEIISNSIMYFATKETGFVRAITIDWEDETKKLGLEIDKSNSDLFSSKFKELFSIVTRELGQSFTIVKRKNSNTYRWEYKNEIIVELEITAQENYNKIQIVISQKKKT